MTCDHVPLPKVIELLETHYNDCEIVAVNFERHEPRYDVYRASLLNRDNEWRVDYVRHNDQYGAWFGGW